MGIKTQRFEDLETWQHAIDLAAQVYKLAEDYPKSEIYGITNQMRRAASSISANIAEGYGRHGTKEKIQFYRIAAGSRTGLKSFFYLSKKIGYIRKEQLTNLSSSLESSHKLINALIRSIKVSVDV